MRTRITRGQGRWDDVSATWKALLDDVPATTHLQQPEWAHAVSEIAHDGSSRWFVAEDDDGPLAVLPYQMKVRRFGPARIRMLANQRVTDGLVAPRLAPQALRRAVLGAASAAGEPLDALSLNGLRPEMGFFRLAVAASSGIGSETRHGGHSVIETRVSGDEWFASAGKNLRASLRKARNRFERRGAMTVTIATTRDDIARAFDEFVAVEATGWKADKGALANRPIDREVLRHYLLASAAHGQVSVRTLRLDGRPAAAQLASCTAGTLELFKVAYDDGLADLSPSNLLMADLIRECCDRDDVTRIDLLTNQEWHDRWHADEHPTYKALDTNLRRPGGAASEVARRLQAAGVRLPRP